MGKFEILHGVGIAVLIVETMLLIYSATPSACLNFYLMLSMGRYWLCSSMLTEVLLSLQLEIQAKTSLPTHLMHPLLCWSSSC